MVRRTMMDKAGPGRSIWITGLELCISAEVDTIMEIMRRVFRVIQI